MPKNLYYYQLKDAKLMIAHVVDTALKGPITDPRVTREVLENVCNDAIGTSVSLGMNGERSDKAEAQVDFALFSIVATAWSGKNLTLDYRLRLGQYLTL